MAKGKRKGHHTHHSWRQRHLSCGHARIWLTPSCHHGYGMDMAPARHHISNLYTILYSQGKRCLDFQGAEEQRTCSEAASLDARGLRNQKLNKWCGGSAILSLLFLLIVFWLGGKAKEVCGKLIKLERHAKYSYDSHLLVNENKQTSK